MNEVIVENLVKNFNEVRAVDTVSFIVPKEKTLTLLGHSGSGKSTVLRCIAGLEVPDAGAIKISGKPVFDDAQKILVPCERRNLGMVFQSYAIWPHLTVFDNVAFGLRIRKTPRLVINQKVAEVLKLVRLSGYEKRYPSQLSGGEQQRVVLARSLAYNPNLLLLDEPLTNLDAKLREEMRHELRDIQKQVKTTMIYVTHDQSEALVLSDIIGVMDKGKLVQLGTPHQIINEPATPIIATFIGNNNVFSGVTLTEEKGSFIAHIKGLGRIACGDIAGSGPNTFVYFDAGNVKIAASDRQSANTWRAEVLRASRIGRNYETLLAVEGVEIRAIFLNQEHEITKGDRIRVFVEPADIRVRKWR